MGAGVLPGNRDGDGGGAESEGEIMRSRVSGGECI